MFEDRKDDIQSDFDRSSGKSNQPLTDAQPVAAPSTGYLRFVGVDYYRSSFDVTTDEVLDRLKHACFPLKSDSIFGHQGKYDLYGPIWIMVTLNVAIAIFGSLSGYLQSVATKDEESAYQHEVIQITGCASFLTFYFIFVPLALWGLI